MYKRIRGYKKNKKANLQNHFHFFFYFNNLVMLVQKLAHTDILKINVIKISKQ